MALNLKYLLGSMAAFPLLPIMYYQGQRIRASVPKLPEATGDTGIAGDFKDRRFNLITLGESTIAGIGVETHSEGFTGSLARRLSHNFESSVHWKVFARSGYTAQIITDKMVPMIQEDSVDLIVIGLGGNDAFSLNSPSKWRRDIQALIDKLDLKYPSVPIVFANMPPIKEFPAFTPLIRRVVGNLVEVLGQELATLAAKQPHVHYYSRLITLEDWIGRLQVKAQPQDFFSDGIHPSKLTYQVWGRDLADFILEEPNLNQRLSASIS